MNGLKLAAVGSSRLVAEEIRQIMRSFLSDGLPIETCITSGIEAVEADTFYVCANTQGIQLQARVPAESLYVFRLEPTTTFFMDIARIPAGKTVYVFNNLFPYAEVLARRCQELGMDQLTFRPIAYEEMPAAEVHQALQQAEYIIGVDIFVGAQVLQSAAYRADLRPDVQILAGRRTASVASANHLLAGIAKFYLQQFQQEWADIRQQAEAGEERLSRLYAQLNDIMEILQQGVLHSVMSQVGVRQTIPSASEAWDRATLSEDWPQAVAQTEELLQRLDYLYRKICKLAG